MKSEMIKMRIGMQTVSMFETVVGEVKFYNGNRKIEMYKADDEMLADNMIVSARTFGQMEMYMRGVLESARVKGLFAHGENCRM